ncbi:hypothetical protein AUJ44_02200 [Candidatus Nomurabacteria bacterium CG1_02_47_685]|uniref:Uncharacterized protein n=1 Tax=Candidatus Nomurabacteria bacterium CG1_02_47_685 TaxID=1805282 RepID=A0A1J4V5W8_9BACT|nr:MAG: hypothetical protein AUJ44_02200 [Candidatus Nomurabacteria bacterium CG1_02_47_685]
MDKRYGEKVWHGKHASGAGETEEDTMTHIYEKYCTYPHFLGLAEQNARWALKSITMVRTILRAEWEGRQSTLPRMVL